VQRLLGDIPLRNRDVVEADISALEQLLQAVLLYDHVIAIDDYKERYREERRSRFPFIRFLGAEQFDLGGVRNAAQSLSDEVEPTIRGGEFADSDFRGLMDRLKMHMICTWDMASSVYYLNMKLLGAPDRGELEKYSRLHAAIFGELQDLSDVGGDYRPEVRLIDSRGREIRSGYTLTDRSGRNAETRGPTPALQAFIASMRWLAYRTTFYSLAADHLRADVMLYPVRQAYHQYLMERTGRYTAEFMAATIALFNSRVSETVEAVINASRPSRIAMRLPMFAAWLANETGDVRTVLKEALRLREERDISEARAQLREIRNLYDGDETGAASKKIQKLLGEVDGVLAGVRRRYGLKTSQGIAVADAIKVMNPILKMKGVPDIPEIGKETRLPEWLTDLWPRRGVGAIYRDVARDLAEFPKLGHIRDVLGSAVDVETKRAGSSLPKTEDPKFRWAKSDWKLPM
jgi:hypothetical protein